MATILAVDIVAEARVNLGDQDEVRWSQSDLLGYLNDAQREIAILRPDASVSVTALQLTANASRHALPATATRLIKITRNMGADGTTPGRAITLAQNDEVDRVDPNWHTATAAAAIEHFVYDGKSPKVFYTYPRPNAALYVEAHLAVPPADATINGVDGETVDSVISVDDVYKTAILDFIEMRARMKASDSFDEVGGDRAYGRFLNRLGLKVVADKATDPNRQAPPKQPLAQEVPNGPSF